MISTDIKNIKTEKNDLRKFGITLGVFFGLLGGLFFWRGKDHHFYSFILSGVFLLVGLAIPLLLKQIYKIWMPLAMLIDLFMSRVILD